MKLTLPSRNDSSVCKLPNICTSPTSTTFSSLSPRIPSQPSLDSPFESPRDQPATTNSLPKLNYSVSPKSSEPSILRSGLNCSPRLPQIDQTNIAVRSNNVLSPSTHNSTSAARILPHLETTSRGIFPLTNQDHQNVTIQTAYGVQEEDGELVRFAASNDDTRLSTSSPQLSPTHVATIKLQPKVPLLPLEKQVSRSLSPRPTSPTDELLSLAEPHPTALHRQSLTPRHLWSLRQKQESLSRLQAHNASISHSGSGSGSSSAQASPRFQVLCTSAAASFNNLRLVREDDGDMDQDEEKTWEKMIAAACLAHAHAYSPSPETRHPDTERLHCSVVSSCSSDSDSGSVVYSSLDGTVAQLVLNLC